MQAAKLPITAGWQWILDGWALYRRQPLPMTMWALMTAILINISYILLIVGQAMLIIVTPMLTFITLSACRRIAREEAMTFGLWLQPVRGRPDIRSGLLKLGVVYFVFCLVAGLLATLPYTQSIAAAIGDDGQIDPGRFAAAIKAPLITFGILYILVSAFFWHAPALIGWHRIKMTQAMFYSMVACWRNKWPFLAYGSSWAAMFIGLQMLGSILVQAGVSPAGAHLMLTPLNLVVAAVLYCSFYPAYVRVFGANHPTDHAGPMPPAGHA